jgi:hypothetical protein
MCYLWFCFVKVLIKKQAFITSPLLIELGSNAKNKLNDVLIDEELNNLSFTKRFIALSPY